MDLPDEEKLNHLIIETHNENTKIHPELITNMAPQLTKNSSTLVRTNNKINKNLDLNEQTDGFITQINVEEAIKPVKQQYNIQTLNPEVLIPNQENNSIKKSKQNEHGFKKDASFLDLSLTGSGTASHMLFHQSAPPLAPILKKHNTNIDLNDTNLSDDYCETLNQSNLKDLNKKLQPNQTSQYLKKSKTDLNSISEFGSSIRNQGKGGSFFSFFPSIPGKSSSKANSNLSRKTENKTKFPVERNYFNRNIYVQYLTDKIEREQHEKNNESSIIKIHQQQHLLPKNSFHLKRHQHQPSSALNYSYTTQQSKSVKNTDNQSSVSANDTSIHEKQVFVDFKGIESPPPSQLGRQRMPKSNKDTSSKAQQYKVRYGNSRFKNYDKVFRKENAFASSSFASNKYPEASKTHQSLQKQSFSTMSHHKGAKKIIDLNQLNNDSKLSSHYLAFHSASHLSELKLYDLWPSSKMYKVTIKTNPWVDSFKAKSYAHEINDSFRHFNSNNKANLLPNIKQIYSI